MKKIIFVGLFLFGNFYLQAQLDNTALSKKLNISHKDAGKLFLQFETLSFVKNNEYFNDIVRGRTFFGYQFSPTLVYFPSKNLRIEAGAFFAKDFGNDNFTTIQSIFSVKYQKNRFSLTFGTLEGALNHQLIEPLYEFENLFTQRLENGLQLKWEGERFYTDLWVDWQRMIYPDSEFQEEIFGSLHLYYNILKSDNFTLRVPFQFTILHKGGQINQSDLPVTNNINQAIGLYADLKINGKFFKGIRTENYFLNFNGARIDSISQEEITLQGQGIYANLMFRFQNFDFMASYWNAKEFGSAQGGEIYRSYDNRLGELVESNRHLLLLRFLTEFDLGNNTKLLFRMTPYWDLEKNIWEFSSGLYFIWRPRFGLAKNLQIRY